MQALILAGGFGTRLSQIVSNVPKPMAPINNNKPLLEYILDNLAKNNITKVILSVGYKSDIIISHFKKWGNNYKNIKIDYVIEHQPLGTGGAIVEAISQKNITDNLLILNGDTYLNLDYIDFINWHQKNNSDISIVCKDIEIADRYGTVITRNNKIIGFKEKENNKNLIKPVKISLGTYIINPKIFSNFKLPIKFSLETDFFQRYCELLNIYYYNYTDYFIDIGIPEDYYRAKTEML